MSVRPHWPAKPLWPDRGFSLIETLVVLALLGILVAIAYPSFANSLAKARRIDGRVALLELQLVQERWR
ncbi:MAG: hypothetical protein RLZZ618_2035, partial [Pseudomonadota bacterium]